MQVVSGEGYSLHEGDCLDVLRTFGDNTFDTVITDPPYGLSDHGVDDVAACLRAWLDGKPYRPAKKGFMGKSWDSWVPGPEVWKECYRALKPGGMMLVFAGTRSMDLMSMAIRLSGFELRDSIGHAHDGGGAPLAAWVYGSGFPKSHDISKAIDEQAGAEREVIGIAADFALDGAKRNASNHKNTRHVGAHAGDMTHGWDRPITAPATDAAKEWAGWGTALKPAWEPIIMAQKKLDGTFAHNAVTHGVAGLNIDGTRIGTKTETHVSKPRHERNGFTKGFVSGTETTQHEYGRWPANLVLDTEAARLLDEMSGELTSGKLEPHHNRSEDRQVYGKYNGKRWDRSFGGDHGGASRYFTVIDSEESRFYYSAKASRSERDAGLEGMPLKDAYNDDNAFHAKPGRARTPQSALGGARERVERGEPPVMPRANNHPTVKSLDLMKFLARLTKTPRGGTVLDPFMGSGSTGVACMIEGRQFVGIEKEPEYLEIARHRIEHWRDEVSTEPRKIKDTATHTDLPLFTELA